MAFATEQPSSDLRQKLHWLILARVAFASLLLGSTILLHLSEAVFPRPGLLLLYVTISGIFVLSFLYVGLMGWVRRTEALAYAQIGVDTLVVSLILCITGSVSSVFVFLYLVVIIYTSMMLYRRGSLIVAGACSIEFAVLAVLESGGVLPIAPLPTTETLAGYGWQVLLYRVLITTGACFAIAMLSSHLSEQARKTKSELRAMEAHVRRVEKMAAVGEMGAGLAHEIKNPLASITGAIQMLRDEIAYDPGTDKLMQITLREADRLSALVNNFLLFARPPSGNPEPLRVDAVLAEMITLFEKSEAVGEQIEIRHAGEPNLWIEMDLDHFKQVLWNLLVNAAEAVEGKGRIAIEQRRTRNGKVLIRISDSGCGMDAENLRSAFDPFFTTKPSGTGLGLSIVLRIVEAYGGSLDLDSRAGEGTTASIRFPEIPAPAQS